MAQYLIIGEPGDASRMRVVEAKNVKDAARELIRPSTYAGEDPEGGFSVQIWRVVGPPKTVTLRLESTVVIEVSDAKEST